MVIVEARTELVKNMEVESKDGKLDRYPSVPKPRVVDVKLAAVTPPPGPNAVEKEENVWLIKLVVEINEEVSEAEEM